METFRFRISSSTAAVRGAGIALLAACLFAPAANAQAPSTQAPSAQPPAQTAPGQPDQSAAISDQKLDAVASALQAVSGLAQDYEQRVDAAPEADKQRIVDEANDALAKAVTDHGLSVEEYTRILVIAKNDPQVRQRIIQRLPQSNHPSGPSDHPSDRPDQPSDK